MRAFVKISFKFDFISFENISQKVFLFITDFGQVNTGI